MFVVPTQACELGPFFYTASPTKVVGKRTAGAVLATFSSSHTITGCTNLSYGDNGNFQSATFGSSEGVYERTDNHAGSFSASNNFKNISYEFKGYLWNNNTIQENIKFKVDVTYDFFAKAGPGSACDITGYQVPTGTGEFTAQDILNIGWSGNNNNPSKPCDGFTVTQKFTMIQTANSLNFNKPTEFQWFYVPHTMISISTYKVYLPGFNTVFTLYPAPTCTFTADSKNLRVALDVVNVNRVNPNDQGTLLQPKKFSLHLAGCSSKDYFHPANLTWKFNNPNLNALNRLKNDQAEGAKGIDMMVRAARGQKMYVDSGLPYTDMTISHLETYRALANAVNSTFDFEVGYVANGEALKPGAFSTTATVTIDYQ
jgi:type 1 fimbria pilin